MVWGCLFLVFQESRLCGVRSPAKSKQERLTSVRYFLECSVISDLVKDLNSDILLMSTQSLLCVRRSILSKFPTTCKS